MASSVENGVKPLQADKGANGQTPVTVEAGGDAVAGAELKEKGTQVNGTDKKNDPKSKTKEKASDKDPEAISDDDKVDAADEIINPQSNLLGLKNKAPNRIRQFGQFLRLMEARMTEMEKELAELKGEPDKALDKATDKAKGDAICEIKSGDMEFFDRITDGEFAFANDPHRFAGSDWKRKRSDQKWVIEVLVRGGMTLQYVEPVAKNEEGGAPLQRINTSLQQGGSDALQPSRNPTPERIRIRSEVLLQYLSQISKGDKTSFDKTMVFLSPFKLFAMNEEKIRAHLQELEEQSKNEGDEKVSEEDATLLPHLRLLVELFDTLLSSTLQMRRALQAKTATHVSFEHLYYLFNYGQEVLCADATDQVYRVYGWTGGRDILVPRDEDDWQPGFTVATYQYLSNGSSYLPLPRQFFISRYYGQREITSLPVYPFEFHLKADEIRKRIEKRGERYIELSSKDNIVHRQYTGSSLDMPPEEIDSQVIIDQFMAIRHNQEFNQDFGVKQMTTYNDREVASRCKCSPNCSAAAFNEIHQDLEEDKQAALEFFAKNKHTLQPPDDLTKPYNEDRILLPHFVYGFVLRSRKWAKLKLDLIQMIEYKNTFDRLVLPRGHAESVRALVLNHSRGPVSDGEKHVEVAMDLVRGKGKGLIILLHGEPGVGKTSTAECIADYTKRPLYPITCGDIGSQAEKVEANLERTFQLAHKWGCVLLLDEADVFLQERTREDIERNAIVSVFLRNMEYYSGILFLTTNRVGTLDQAFRSRIHLSLYYPALDEEATLKIWKMHIDTARQLFSESTREIIIEKDDILGFARDNFREMKDSNSATWNGRQIRNAFQTAIALAEMDATTAGGNPHLRGKQFEVVAKTSKDFDDYLRVTQGGTSARLARQHKLRHDEFRAREEKGRVYGKKAAAAKPKGKKKRGKESSNSSGSESSEDSSESEEAVRKKAKKGKAKKVEKVKKKKQNSSSDETSSSEEKPLKKEKKKTKKRDDNS